MSKLRVDVLVPTYRQFSANAHISIQAMVVSLSTVYDVYAPPCTASGVVHWTRNDSLKRVRPNADYVLFCDDDMVPEPGSAQVLIEHELPVVSALTTTRAYPVKLTIKAFNRERNQFVPIDAVKPGALLKGDFGIGFGFVVVQNSVLKKLKHEWLEARDWLRRNVELFQFTKADPDLVGEYQKRLSEERKGKFKRSHGTTRVFEFLEAGDGEEEGEDLGFCRKCLDIGIPIAVDAAVQVGHLGEFPFGPWNLGHEGPKDENLAV